MCKNQRAVLSFTGNPGYTWIPLDAPDACCELIARSVLSLLFVAAPQHLAQGLAIRVCIHVDAQDFELPVLKGPEIQIVHRDWLAIFRLAFYMQGGNELISLDDDISRASVGIDEVTAKMLIGRTQSGFAP
jgi:hypothetical protein